MFKNKGKFRRLTAFITAVLILIPFTATHTYAADPTAANVIHEERTTQAVTQGVTLENIVRFTKDGWYNLHVLKVDLTQKYISIDTLSSTESFAQRASTLKLAEQNGAVAAVNGSFFTPAGTGYGFPVGGIVGSSELQSVSDNINRYSDSMASFSITDDNKAVLEFWKADMKLVSESGASIAFQHYNKKSWNDFSEIYVYDRKWGEKAFGATTDMPDMFQMVVENGVVTHMLTGEPALKIPENGFIAVTRSDGARKLRSMFTIGDKAHMEITTTPDWKKLKMSVSGSAILVENGIIPEKFSFEAADIMARSPKTALGISKNGKTLYLVTVDGRQTASIGLTLRGMAEFMQSIGAYNALNMDGGGSTTMVARPLGESSVKVMNKPSDGVVRSVINAVGVISTAPPAELAGIIIETDDRYMFTHTTRAFTVKGYDKHLNPIEVDLDEVEWSVSGVKGTFEGNVFRPSTYGEGTIKASIGKISSTIRVSVLSRPVSLTLDSKSLKLPLGKSKTFKITGTNPRGYTASINAADLNWKVVGDMGSISDDGVFTAEKRGAGYIEGSFGDAYVYCPVAVSAETAEVIDGFEEVKGAFQSYPETIVGHYAVASEQKVSGKSSGKLVYDFTTNTDVTRAAYYVLPETGYELDADTHKIGLHVYNDHENSGWLRAELVDADGKRQVVDFTRTLDWVGWKYVEASAENIKKPARLHRIYIVQVNPDMDAGCLYFDDLTFISDGYPSLDDIKVPEDTPFIDEANKAVSFTKATADSFRFGVMGQSKLPENDVEKRLTKVFADKVTKYLEIGAVVGSGSHESITGSVKGKPVVATHTVDLKSTKEADYAYSVTDFKNSRFIKLDTRKKGLRLSDPDQWNKFLRDLESFKGKNVFIFMESSPETFTDKLEMALFKKTLKDYRFDTLKNVCVFYKGSENKCTVEDGVRYFETAGYEVSGINSKDTGNAQYVLVTVKGSEVTYVYKPIES